MRADLHLSDQEIEQLAQRAAEYVVAALNVAGVVNIVKPVSPTYMSIPEVAEYLRCSRQRVDDLLSQGQLPRVKEGRRTLLARADVEAHLRKDGEV